jgi:Zn finger protein HypA/HybF involved in hydrogenase expression
MLEKDPYTPTESRYECRDCLEHVTSEDRLEECPECGGRMHNVAVPRE